jgi:hypothetical protein
MWNRIFLSAILSMVAPTSLLATERIPFHVSHFPDDLTISLRVTALTISHTSDYDFDVSIGLTEIGRNGDIVFDDNNNHNVQVRCLSPGEVLVGGVAYVLPSAVRLPDWKEDLWKALCSSPLS